MMLDWVRPWALALLVVALGHLVWLARTRPAALPLPRAGALAARRRWAVLALAPDLLRALAFAVLVLALARPRTPGAAGEARVEGVPIAIAIDISSSMLAEDFAARGPSAAEAAGPQARNRLEVARAATRDFVLARPDDPMAIVAFAGEAITMVPLTTDRRVLSAALNNLQVGLLEDGTAIGMGLATAASRLEGAGEAGSRVVILLSDGENNRGEIEPLEAARAAAALGIRVYTVGVGTDEAAPVPIRRGPDGEVLQFAEVPVGIDEPLLREVARLTGGAYFRADDPQALREIYAELDRLVSATVDVRRSVAWREWYPLLVLLGAGLLLGEWALRGSRWGRLP